MAYKRRVTRKQFLKRPDEFISGTQRFMAYLQDNTKIFYTLLIAAAGIIVVGGIVWMYLNGVKAQARTLEDEALKIYHRPVLTEEETKKSGRGGFKNDAERYKAAYVKFEQLVDKYGWTNSARRGLLYLGDCYYGLKEYEKAKVSYKQYLDKYPDDKIVGYLLWQNLGYINEEQNKYDEAITCYEEAITHDAPSAGEFQLQLDIARCYELKKDWSKALAKYKEAVSAFPDFPKTEQVDLHLQEVEAILSSVNS